MGRRGLSPDGNDSHRTSRVLGEAIRPRAVPAKRVSERENSIFPRAVGWSLARGTTASLGRSAPLSAALAGGTTSVLQERKRPSKGGRCNRTPPASFAAAAGRAGCIPAGASGSRRAHHPGPAPGAGTAAARPHRCPARLPALRSSCGAPTPTLSPSRRTASVALPAPQQSAAARPRRRRPPRCRLSTPERQRPPGHCPARKVVRCLSKGRRCPAEDARGRGHHTAGAQRVRLRTGQGPCC